MSISLKEKYGTFKTITENLNTKTVKKEFWKIERKNIIKQIKKGKEEKTSMRMSFDKYIQKFDI